MGLSQVAAAEKSSFSPSNPEHLLFLLIEATPALSKVVFRQTLCSCLHRCPCSSLDPKTVLIRL